MYYKLNVNLGWSSQNMFFVAISAYTKKEIVFNLNFENANLKIFSKLKLN